MVSYQANDPNVRALLVPEEACAVQRMEASCSNGRRVPDVVQHRSRFQQLCIATKDRAQGASALGDSERVRPSAR